MAGQTLSLTLQSGLAGNGFGDAGTAIRGLGQDAGETSQSLGGISGGLGVIRDLLPAVGLAEFLKTTITWAMDAEEAQRHLETAVKAVGGSWEKQGVQIESYVSNLAQAAGFQKTESMEALSGLILKTHDVAMAQRDLALAMDIVKAKGGSLEEWSQTVGLAAEGNARGTIVLAKAFGVVGKEAQDSLQTLNAVQKSIGGLAVSEDNAVKTLDQLWNSIKTGGTVIGDILLNALASVAKPFNMLISFFKDAASAADHLWAILRSGIGTKEAHEATIAFNADLQRMGHDLMSSKTATDKLTQSMGALGTEAKENAKHAAEMAKAAKKAAEERLKLWEDQAKVDFDAITKHHKEIEKQEKEHLKKMAEMDEQFGMQGTEFMITLFTTQKGNQKKFLEAQLLMMATKAAAGILMNAAEGSSVSVAQAGLAGIGIGAGVTAWGAVAAGAVTALGQAAAANLESGGSMTMPGTGGAGGGGSGGSVSGGAAAPAAQQGVNVYIQGDVMSDDAFMMAMGRRLSDLVQSKNLNLQASRT